MLCTTSCVMLHGNSRFGFPMSCVCISANASRRGCVRGCGSVCESSVRKFLFTLCERAFRIVCSSLGQQRFRVERAGFIACSARTDGPRLAFLCCEGCVCVWSSSRYCWLFDLKGKKERRKLRTIIVTLVMISKCDCRAPLWALARERELNGARLWACVRAIG